jgi:hypothetical protein
MTNVGVSCACVNFDIHEVPQVRDEPMNFTGQLTAMCHNNGLALFNFWIDPGQSTNRKSSGLALEENKRQLCSTCESLAV